MQHLTYNTPKKHTNIEAHTHTHTQCHTDTHLIIHVCVCVKRETTIFTTHTKVIINIDFFNNKKIASSATIGGQFLTEFEPRFFWDKLRACAPRSREDHQARARAVRRFIHKSPLYSTTPLCTS